MRPTFCIWAEEKGDLGAQNTGKSEWGFGSAAGGYPLSRGVVIGVPKCKVISMTLDVGDSNTNSGTIEKATVKLTKNGNDTEFHVSTSYASGRTTGYNVVDPGDADVIFEGGDTVNFRTTEGGGNTQRGVVCAWFERLE